MAKKTTSSTSRPAETKPAARAASTTRNARAAKAVKPPAPATATITEQSVAKAEPAKPAKPAKPRSTRASKEGTPAPAPQPNVEIISRESIALRAYFIAERRRAKGDCREPAEDWLEAEREIAAEIKKSRKPKA